MDQYISANAEYNSTYEQTQSFKKQRSLIRLNNYGVALISNSGQLLKEENFPQAVKDSIANSVAMNFNIRCKDIPDDDTNTVPDFGGYVNTGLQYDMIEKLAPDTASALRRMITNENPGISPQEVESRLDNMPGVGDAKGYAITEAWEGAA